MHPANIRYLLGCLLGPQTSRDSSACRASYSLMLNMWHPLGRVLWSPAEPDPEWGSVLGLWGGGSEGRLSGDDLSKDAEGWFGADRQEENL